MAENKNTYGIIYLLVAAVAVGGFFFLFKKVDGLKDRNEMINSISNINSSNYLDASFTNTDLLREEGWFWISTTYRDNTNFSPAKDGIFNLVIKNDNTFTSTTDCNNAFGKYRLEGDIIMFFDIGSTEMYCEGSRESVYLNDLSNVETFSIDEKQVLIFNLKDNKGEMIFNQKVLKR